MKNNYSMQKKIKGEVQRLLYEQMANPSCNNKRYLKKEEEIEEVLADTFLHNINKNRTTLLSFSLVLGAACSQSFIAT
jgi:hypothetical protein